MSVPPIVAFERRGGASQTDQSLDLHRLERRILERVAHIVRVVREALDTGVDAQRGAGAKVRGR